MKKIYVDGSASPMGSAICIIEENDKDIKHIMTFEKRFESYKIEYIGLSQALSIIPNKETIIYIDNKSIFSELTNGKRKKFKSSYYHTCKKLLDSKPLIKIEWIPRDKNKAGIYLEARIGKLRKHFNSVFHPKPKKKKYYYKKRKGL